MKRTTDFWTCWGRGCWNVETFWRQLSFNCSYLCLLAAERSTLCGFCYFTLHFFNIISVAEKKKFHQTAKSHAPFYLQMIFLSFSFLDSYNNCSSYYMEKTKVPFFFIEGEMTVLTITLSILWAQPGFKLCASVTITELFRHTIQFHYCL